MASLTRRGVLKIAALGATTSMVDGLLPGACAIGPKTHHPAGAATLSAAQSDGGVVFEDHFDKHDIACKPAYAIIADTRGAPRRVHTPSIIEGRDGVLIAAWSSNGSVGDNDPSNFIEVSRSADGGLSWSKPAIACPPSVINPTFIRARNGDPVMFYNLNHSIHQDDCSVAFRRSTDNGQTWSEAHMADVGARIVICVNNGLLLPSGDWLISFQYDRSGQTGEFDVRKCDYVAAVAISSDEGVTWHRYGDIVIPNLVHWPNNTSWAVEPTVFPRPDRSLGMVLRTDNGRLYQSVSRDQGRTWSDASPMAFSNDNSKANALTLSSGNVVLLEQHKSAGRLTSVPVDGYPFNRWRCHLVPQSVHGG